MKGKMGYSESGMHLACVVLPHSVVHFFFFIRASCQREGLVWLLSFFEMLLIAVVFLVFPMALHLQQINRHGKRQHQNRQSHP